MEELAQTVHDRLSQIDCQCSVVPIQHLADLRAEIAGQFEKNLFDSAFYDERLTHFDFQLPSQFPDARSILVTAMPHPKVRVTFHVNGVKFPVFVPPTYTCTTDDTVRQILSIFLAEAGYTLYDARLPEKILAVSSGLARYGRNNIAYVDPWGSYVRFKIFLSDMPCESDPWQGFQPLERCQSCRVCQNLCPTGAINPNRFLIHAERCLTFLNEKPGNVDFPAWAKSEWHHCLVGCMICQDVCPGNRKNRDWIKEGESFSEEETAMILAGKSREALPEETQDKIKRLNLFDDYDILPRNLNALIKKG